MDEIHVNDIGTEFLVTVKDGDEIVDISTADTLQLIFTKPTGTKVTQTATLYTDGTDGKMKYISEDGDLDVAGWWKLQGFISISDSEWHTNVVTFQVHRNL